MSEEEREQFLNDSGYYTERQVAAFLNMTVPSLRNRHIAKRNCPPRTPEKIYPIKEFKDWNQKRLQFQLNRAS